MAWHSRPSSVSHIMQVALGDARMLEEMSLKASHHGNTRVGLRGSDEDSEEKQTYVDLNPESGLYLQSSETCFPTRSSQLHDDLNELSDEWSSIGDLSQDASFSLEGCVRLERRWMLWYEFKKELSCLDDWLRSAEKIAASPNSSHVLYVTAKEELQKYENLRAEARIRLIQLDGLTKLCQTLVGLFRGAMGARLVEMTKDCGQRWDQLSNTVETVCRRLKHFICQREDFERQREEMAVWLADMDLRLTEVEHFSGKDTCSKMHQLQGFQEAVGESAGRLNDLLQHGEELIQRSEPGDAQVIENQLQELLLHCTRVFQGLGHLHTRLLSMRLGIKKSLEYAAPPQTPVPVIRAGEPQYTRPFKTSKLETRSPEPVTFDPERISAWLGQTHQLCSKAVQTEHDPQRQQERLCFPDSLEDNTRAESSRDLCGPEASASSLRHIGTWLLGPLRFFNVRKASAPLLVLLFALLLAVVIWPLILLHDTSCHRSNTLTRSFHLALRYKGPPPT
ncbi:hypothetical protein cypCar_00000832 [Cyprinus carpio]|nr:hypothetical protein cypCar_00000832 [Cyprinus carpio]